MSKKIAIYQGEGTSNESIQHAVHTIGLLIRNVEILCLSAKDFFEKSWSLDCSLFVMPGGRDLPYEKTLRGHGNSIIHNFVKRGGAYLGLCAGAYYGSSYVEFDRGGPLEVRGERNLCFFPETAVGPLFGPYQYDSFLGARAVSIRTNWNDSQFEVFFNGGPFFQNLDHETKVLAYYHPIQKPAVIERKVGNGIALLSGVHFEYDEYILPHQDVNVQNILPSLSKSRTQRLDFATRIFSRLGLSA